MGRLLIVAWAVIMLSGCAAHSVSVDGTNIHVSLYGIDVADVSLPQGYTYLGKEKIGLSPNGTVPSFLRCYQCENSYFGISTALVEKVDFVDRIDSPYTYMLKIGRNNAPFKIDSRACYKLRSIVTYYPGDKSIFKCVYANKDINYIVAMYWEKVPQGTVLAVLPREEKELTSEHKNAIQQFEDRADIVLGCVELH